MPTLRNLTHTLAILTAWSGLAIGVALGTACDSRPTTTASVAPPPTCPECECKCSCPGGTAGTATPTKTSTTPSTTPAASSEEAEELAYAISRKIAKRDGSCLADLERLTEIAPRTARRMGFVRGQCLMLAGRCSAGAEVVRKEMKETTDMLDEQLDRTIESYVGMYCTGPLDDRGELLRALMELQKGAYQGNIGIRACTNATKTVSRLRTRVKPKNDEDTQISSLDSYFGYTAAACFARAGDCGTAWKVFNDEFRVQIPDPKTRAEVIRSSFDSMVTKCKGRP